METLSGRMPVWLVDDNNSYCVILSEALNRSKSFYCERYYNSVKTVLRGLTEREILPQIILLDIKMPLVTGLDGISSIKKICPDVLIVMLTSYDETSDIRIAMQRGANGYLSKNSSYEDIIHSLERLSEEGGRVVDPGIVDKLVSSVVVTEPIDYRLSRREKEIIGLLTAGETLAEISTRLNLSFYTVDTHLKNIYQKLDVHSFQALVVKASKENLTA